MRRIDPAVYDAALKHTGCRTVVMRKRRCGGYVFVDASALGTRRALHYWIELALGYNARVTRK
jgi:hypothetical protein